jgi:hypothetical protein
MSSPYSSVNLVDAAFFSALAYAPPGQNAIQWGLAQGANDAHTIAAENLTANGAGWTDQTANLVREYNTLNPGNRISFSDAGQFNEFRVFVNSQTDQIVFAFKGSSFNANNWLSDIATNDQGYSQYLAIEADAETLYKFMNAQPQRARGSTPRHCSAWC